MRVFKSDRKPTGFYSKKKAKRKKAIEAWKKRPDSPVGFHKAGWKSKIKTKQVPTTRNKDLDCAVYYPGRSVNKK